MVRRYKETIFIVRDHYEPLKGWGWVDVDTEVVKRLGMSTVRPQSIFLDHIEHKALQALGKRYPQCINPPHRVRAAGKKFVVNINGDFINLSVQKSLTIEAVCAWVKTWASPDAKIITPGNKTISLVGEPIAKGSAFVYFVFNADSNAIKIGKARDLEKRIRSLQTVSPSRLKLLKATQVTDEKEASLLESSLRRKFAHLRITGEWFKAESELLDYLENL